MSKKTIMIVEDEPGIRGMTHRFLNQEGYHVVPVENGEQALESLNSVQPHLILLDIEMPGIDGFTVCREVRRRMTVPIIFLTVRRNKIDKVKCFELGGDDYVTKPFDFEVLGARIKANIRRYHAYSELKEQRNILKFDELEIDLHKYECRLDGELIDLSTKEMELLIHLAKHPNQVWGHEQLYDHIWTLDATGNIETVKVHISFLRSKLEKDPKNPKFIKTVRGFGYLFSD